MYPDQTDIFKSIDELLEFYLTKNVINLKRVNVYEYLMRFQPREVLIALTSGSNTQSIHDLNLINAINQKHFLHDRTDEWMKIINKILKIYSDRRVK